MDQHSSEPHPPRRINPVRKALKPVYQCIGELREKAVFLQACLQRADRSPIGQRTGDELVAKRNRLSEVMALFNAAVEQLPKKSRRDSRLADTLAAIEQLRRTFDNLDLMAWAVLPLRPESSRSERLLATADEVATRDAQESYPDRR